MSSARGCRALCTPTPGPGGQALRAKYAAGEIQTQEEKGL